MHVDVGGPDDRPTVVTGGSSGIGWALCESLTRSGTPVICVDLAEPPDALPGLSHIHGDVGQESTWSAVASTVREMSPRGARALFSCAGTILVEDVVSTDAEAFERLMRVNVTSALLGMKALLPAMCDAGDGAIVAVASIDAQFVEPAMGAYAASKAALVQLVRTAALEHARDGIRINVVCPGAIDTPLLQRHLASEEDPVAARASLEEAAPIKRLIAPEEIASVIRFLGGPEASAMSGAIVIADGGLTSTYGQLH